MIEAQLNLWDSIEDKSIIRCITTNGFITKQDRNVMGRGVAADALRYFIGVDYKLGTLIKNNGNIVQIFNEDPILVSFPVKPNWIKSTGDNVLPTAQKKFKLGGNVPGYYAKADLDLIERSCVQLEALTTTKNWKNVRLPRPGCGNGGLNWEIVKPILDKYLDNRFTVVNL